MQIVKPDELIGKEVYDDQGTAVGVLDKYWTSWNQQEIGWFFGIRSYENVRDAWFRGTMKLFPIHSGYIKKIGETVTLKRRMDELSQEWKRVISFKQTSWPTDYLMERGIYDKEGSRVGIFFAWAKYNNTYQYGCFIDPYLLEKWHYAFNIILPLKVDYFYHIANSITLNTTIEDLKKVWDSYLSKKNITKTVSSIKKVTLKTKTRKKQQKRISLKNRKQT